MDWLYEDGEQELSNENLIRLLVYIENGAYIDTCIKNTHNFDIISANEKRVASTIEKGHFCWKKDYIRY